MKHKVIQSIKFPPLDESFVLRTFKVNCLLELIFTWWHNLNLAGNVCCHNSLGNLFQLHSFNYMDNAGLRLLLFCAYSRGTTQFLQVDVHCMGFKHFPSNKQWINEWGSLRPAMILSFQYLGSSFLLCAIHICAMGWHNHATYSIFSPFSLSWAWKFLFFFFIIIINLFESHHKTVPT
jgi:hypothetical protein